MFLILFSFFFALFAFVLFKSNKKLKYWQKKKVQHLKPLPFIGNIWPLISGKETPSEFITKIYNSYPTERVCGFYNFHSPVLVVRDIELIKKITIKHFEHFVDHSGFSASSYTEPLWAKNLFVSKGERWHNLRATSSPVFSTSKMRAMFDLMNECAQRFNNYFKKQKDDLIKVEMKDLCSRFANDIIASTAFGVTCDSLANQNNEFLTCARELTEFSGKNKFKFLINYLSPRLAYMLNMKIISNRVGSFFRKIITETINIRKEKKLLRPDLIHLLLMARQEKLKSATQYISDEDITALAIGFVFGGFESVSTSIAFNCYELAINPEIQHRLRNEIGQIHKECNGVITYDKLALMKYMDMVISETFRKWTQVFWLDRECTKDFTIKATKPGESDIELKKGDVCWIPSWAIHRDAKFYPNPEKFDPERFSDENKDKIQSGTYLVFGSGPRMCIASRFALMETKIFLYYLLLSFELVAIESTVIPIQVKRNSPILNAEGGVNLGLKRL